MSIKLQITSAGGIAMLHDDAIDLREFGKPEISRASHVEPDSSGLWYVQSAKTGEIIKSGFDTRAEALAFEKEYYSPGGQGWAELNNKETA